MKPHKIFQLLLPAVIIGASSCKKEEPVRVTSSVTVINAVTGISSLVGNFSGQNSITWYQSALTIKYGTDNDSYHLGSYSGKQQFGFYKIPDTLATSQPVVKVDLDLAPGGTKTIFLTGTAAAPAAVVTDDQPPAHQIADSSIGVRFVNLSPGSSPVSVNLAGKANGSEVSGLGFKATTAFGKYPAKTASPEYKFEFRDAVSGVLLGTYTFYGVANGAGSNTSSNSWRYRNFTIALKGLPGVTAGPDAQSLFLIRNY
jgi:hypothetical protein